jgi:hypothetical protein
MAVMHSVVCVSRMCLFISHFFNQSGKCRAGDATCVQLVKFGYAFLRLFYLLGFLTCYFVQCPIYLRKLRLSQGRAVIISIIQIFENQSQAILETQTITLQIIMRKLYIRIIATIRSVGHVLYVIDATKVRVPLFSIIEIMANLDRKCGD